MYKRAFLVGLLLLCGGCTPNASVVSLRTALIGVKAAADHGATNQKFADLVLDARTKFEVAKPNLSQEDTASVERAIVAAEDAKAVWNGMLSPGEFDPEMFDPLHRLGLVNDMEDFKYKHDLDAAGAYINHDMPDVKSRNVFIRKALGICADRVGQAIKTLSG